MEAHPALPVFDGHNDTLEMLYVEDRARQRSFFERGEEGHIDLPRARAGGLAGGLFSVFVPSESESGPQPGEQLGDTRTSYALPQAPSLDLVTAQRVTLKGVAALYRLEAASGGRLQVVTTLEDLRACMEQGVLAAVLHVEGAASIDPDLDALYVFHRAGLRSLGIAWSRSNAFASGVPFMFPHSPDTGPGLTDAGKALVQACNRLGIMLDVSHLNEKGFWDVAKFSDAPLVATHSGVHALCPSTRNLTDKQLDAIGASGGVVGINFHVAFLRPDGRLEETTPLQEIVRHITYVAERIGIDHVALGSDFDGGTMPRELGDVAGLPKLIRALRESGCDEDALGKVASANWLRVFGRTWKP